MRCILPVIYSKIAIVIKDVSIRFHWKSVNYFLFLTMVNTVIKCICYKTYHYKKRIDYENKKDN